MQFGISEDGKKITFMNIDGKVYSVAMIDATGNCIDFNDIGETYKKIVDEQNDKCKNIRRLGTALTYNAEISLGFLLGWVIKSIKDTLENESNTSYNIQIEEESVTKGQIRQYTAESLRTLADEIENSEDDDAPRSPIIKKDVAGDDIF
jgi:hypothetical protein